MDNPYSAPSTASAVGTPSDGDGEALARFLLRVCAVFEVVYVSFQLYDLQYAARRGQASLASRAASDYWSFVGHIHLARLVAHVATLIVLVGGAHRLARLLARGDERPQPFATMRLLLRTSGLTTLMGTPTWIITAWQESVIDRDGLTLAGAMDQWGRWAQAGTMVFLGAMLLLNADPLCALFARGLPRMAPAQDEPASA